MKTMNQKVSYVGVVVVLYYICEHVGINLVRRLNRRFTSLEVSFLHR